MMMNVGTLYLTGAMMLAGLGSAQAAGGMPQLDSSTFASQLFWLVVTFSVLFIILWKVAIPRVGDVIEARAQKIRADLERAEQLSAEITEAEASVAKSLADARAEAQDILRKQAESIAADHAKKAAKLDSDLAKKIAEAETRIAAARTEALTSVQDVAQEVAAASVAKLTGGSADTAAVSAAVKAASKEG